MSIKKTHDKRTLNISSKFSAAITRRVFDVTKYNMCVVQMLVFDNSDKFSDMLETALIKDYKLLFYTLEKQTRTCLLEY